MRDAADLAVLRFPPFELSNQVLSVLEGLSSIELLRIRFVAPLHLAVGLGTCGRDVLMGDAQIRKMPIELRPKGRIVVRLDLLDGKGEMLPHLLEKLDRRSRIVMIVDPQDAESSRFVNGGELVEALACPRCPRNEFHIELHRTTGNSERGVIRLRARTVPSLGNRTHMVTVKELVNGCR